MALPVEIVTRTVTYGPETDFQGNSITGSLTFTPSEDITWVAAGQGLHVKPITVNLNSSGSGSIDLICTDQTGFRNANGQNITNWFYTVTADLVGVPGSTRKFVVPSGVGSLDLDTMIPITTSGTTISVPVIVNSVAGRTGAVTLTKNDVGLGSLDASETSLRIAADATKVDKGALVFNVKDYGAVGDGVTDDTAAINACLLASTSRVYFPPGTYMLVPDAAFHMLRVTKQNMELFGAGRDVSVLKVSNTVGDYISMVTNLSAVGALTDASGVYVHDLGFNQNNTGNTPGSIPTLMATKFRFILRFVTGVHGGRVERCHFSDSESVCNIIVTDGNNWSIRDNVFDGVGPGAYHDHSTLNIRGDGTQIRSNVFTGTGQAAWTAMEIHGNNTRVQDNKVTAYGHLGITCGTLVTGFSNVWANNIGKGMAQGISIWANDDMTAAPLVGPAVKELQIVGNQIEIDFDRWSAAAFASTTRSGVELQVGSTGVAYGVKITGNTITYLPVVTGTLTSTDNSSAGILWRRGGAVVTEGTADELLEITGNVVVGAFSAGIYVDPFFSMNRLKINNNMLIDCGSGCPNTAYRKGVWVVFTTAHGFTLSDAEITGNTVIDTRATHLMLAGIDTTLVDLIVNGRQSGNNARCVDAFAIPAVSGNAAQPWSTIEYVTPNVQVFTASGTYTKPSGAKVIRGVLIAPGGGGGSGRRGAAASIRCGGGGGAGGGVTAFTSDAADFSATVSVSIGTAGAGGAAVTANDTNGNAGSAGGVVSFGSYNGATGGNGGAGGTTSTGTGGTAGVGSTSGGVGGSASATGGAGGAALTAGGAGGGGSGGGITSGDVAGAGGVGLTSRSAIGSSVAAGVVDSTAPSSGTAPTVKGTPGPGAGGGAASITTVAQSGVTPNGFGGGGSGGGASLNGNNSGAGGTGAAGYALIITTF